MKHRVAWLALFLMLSLVVGNLLMRAEDILNNTDPEELRNILWRLRQQADGLSSPPPTEIVNQAPSQFPPLSSDVDFDLGWINVKDHGAVGDGVNDDTNAITNAINALTLAGGGVLYFPPGVYSTSGGFTISVPCMVLGMGELSTSTYVSGVLCTSATASLFTVSADCVFKDICLINTAGSTPSAGAGITVTSANYQQRVMYSHVIVSRFYIDVDVQVGEAWVMDNCAVTNPVLYGLRVRNTVNNDAGDWCVSNSYISEGSFNADAGIRIESGGGGKIINCKFNGASASAAFLHGIDLSPTTSATGILMVSNCSIENVRGHGIRALTAFAYYRNVFNGIQFGLSWRTSNATGNCINMNGDFDDTVIADCVFTGGTTPAAISLTGLDNVKIVGNVNDTFSSLITQSGCTNIIIIEPGSTVTGETSYGLSSAVGTSTYYAREDHTHGSPSLSTATPADVGSGGAAGSGSTPSKNDHAHKGVHSLAKSGDTALYGDVTLSEGSGIAITRTGNDLQIASASSGKYRQFVYEVSGGNFSFVIDEDGSPVMALENLE